MNSAVLMINNQRIPLREDADLRGLIAELTSALDQGGGFVHVRGLYNDAYDVLVTAATQIIVRHGSVTIEVGGDHEPWNSSVDLDI